MIKILRAIKSLLPNRWKNTGKRSEWYQDLLDSVHNKLSRGIGSLERMREVILFIPVIYKTVRWDHSSLFIILKHWLSRMEDLHRKDTLHSNAKVHAEQLHKCVLLLDRITKQEYEEKLYELHDAKWGELKTWSEKSESHPGFYEYKSSRTNVLTKEDKEKERKDSLYLYKHSNYLYNQDIEYLFKIIKKQHTGWWT